MSNFDPFKGDAIKTGNSNEFYGEVVVLRGFQGIRILGS